MNPLNNVASAEMRWVLELCIQEKITLKQLLIDIETMRYNK
jgi:hypothetical protein